MSGGVSPVVYQESPLQGRKVEDEGICCFGSGAKKWKAGMTKTTTETMTANSQGGDRGMKLRRLSGTLHGRTGAWKQNKILQRLS